jgi:exopolysaccharide biosynthesis polyprenyl glycosylphosphotransferase
MAAGGSPSRRMLDMPTQLRGLITDLVAIGAGWSIALLLGQVMNFGSRRDVADVLHFGEGALAVTCAVIVTLLLFRRNGLYRTGRTSHRTEEVSQITGAILIASGIATVALTMTTIPAGLAEVAMGTVLTFLFVLIGRGYQRTFGYGSSRPSARQRVVLVGAGSETKELVDLLEEHSDAGYEVVGIVGDRDVARRSGLGDHWLGPTDQILAVLQLVRADSVMVTTTGFRGPQFRRVTSLVLEEGYDLRISPGISRWNTRRLEVDSLVHEPLLSIRARRISGGQARLKRAIDVVGAAVLLLVSAPLLAAVALAIKLEDGGPVLFRQRRIGTGGVEFTMTKFRSMVVDAETKLVDLTARNERSGPLFKLRGDPRVTKIGSVLRESSIDELPQLLDVLRGDMSLIGPRPPLPDEREKFDPELQRRFTVRPGITGLWQVEARGNPSFGAYRRLDLHYVENWSLWLDLCIVLATVEQLMTNLAMLPLRRITERRLRRASPLAQSKEEPQASPPAPEATPAPYTTLAS